MSLSIYAQNAGNFIRRRKQGYALSDKMISHACHQEAEGVALNFFLQWVLATYVTTHMSRCPPPPYPAHVPTVLLFVE